MVERSDVVCFPAFLFDGDKEIDLGSVGVSKSTRFRSFQSSVSQIIGISPHQFTLFLVYNNESKLRRRVPITGKFDFGSILSKTDCFFLVVLKRSKRDRRRRVVDSEDEYGYSSGVVNRVQNRKSPPENVMILRRNPVIDDRTMPFSDFIVPTDVGFGFDQRIQYLQYERQKYLMNMGMNGLSIIGDMNASTVVCEECSRGPISAINGGFHLCVCDPIVVGFRTAAGPIARPGKRPD